MRALIQRVSRASVTAGDHHAAIGPGLLILLGVRRGDTAADAAWLARKCAGLRIFEDDAGKMNLGLLDVGGGALVISQFTLYGDADRGRRPSFVEAAPPDEANLLYEQFVAELRAAGVRRVGTGVFQAMMSVELVNEGPVTVMVESRAGGGAGASNSVRTELAATDPPTGPPNSVQAESLAQLLVPLELPLVLASASPRRTEILARAGIDHVVAPTDADETLVPGESPAAAAATIAYRKVEAAAARWPGRWVLAADTIVDVGGVPLGKPVDAADARRMLETLSGRPHQVHTALALAGPDGAIRVAVESTTVHVRPLPGDVIDRYVASGEPCDKAGAYAIQGLGSLLIDRIDGAYDNVVGLPLARLVALFAEARRG